MTDRNVLVVTGGANRGIIPAAVSASLEEYTGKQMFEMFDMFIGTSVGALLCGVLAAEKRAKVMLDLLRNKDKTYFPQRPLWKNVLRFVFGKQSIYDAQPILDDYRATVGDFKLKDSKKLLMTTSISMNDQMTHYFKSDDLKDGERKLIDLIPFAFAAPYYFGMRNSDADQTTWCDAGAGTDNNPIVKAWTEVLARGWYLDGHVNIFVFGTGSYEKPDTTPYSITKKWGLIRQLANLFMLASSQSDYINLAEVEFYTNIIQSVDIHVIDPILPAGTKSFGDIQYDDLYYQLAQTAFNKALADGTFSCLL